MLKLFKLSFILLFPHSLFAQVEGYVYETKTNTPIEGVLVFVKNRPIHTYTNSKGFFSLQEKLNTGDTIVLTKENYSSKSLQIRQERIKVYLNNEEEIEPISITSSKEKIKYEKVGDTRKPFLGILGLFSNTNTFIQTRSGIVSYIKNNYGEVGQIDKIYIKFLVRKSRITQIDLSSGKKLNNSLQNPEYIKLKLLFLSVGENKQPAKQLLSEEIIVSINKYKSQWLDVSNYKIPFPENGAFVGIEVIEIKGKDGWGNVYIPILYSENEENDMFYKYNDKWFLKDNKGSILGKERKYTYGFGAEVSFFKK